MDPQSKVTDKVVSVIADKLLSGTWLRVTKRVREEKREHEAATARVDRLRGALGVLAEGLALNFASEESARKIAQAVNELQTEGPPGVDADLERVVGAVSSAVQRGDWKMSQQLIYDLMKPIRAKVGPLVGKRG